MRFDKAASARVAVSSVGGIADAKSIGLLEDTSLHQQQPEGLSFGFLRQLWRAGNKEGGASVVVRGTGYIRCSSMYSGVYPQLVLCAYAMVNVISQGVQPPQPLHVPDLRHG